MLARAAFQEQRDQHVGPVSGILRKDRSGYGSAVGVSLGARATYRWPFGLQLGAEWAWRREGGSDQDVVTVMGMQTTAFWPGNTTWTLLALVGFGF